ncbi:hypothetical protein BIW11_03201 [Tropilaelaps mercedesae]|uniref:Uncharacterized protein n=1 Tax=Tropilaelaps mercedesae TaxID=418985 RepID=A0A1V9XQH0_9ACAR|nr:hypothetical protein BIW11_03201 [Tropilaelaps mercedesae]
MDAQPRLLKLALNTADCNEARHSAEGQ